MADPLKSLPCPYVCYHATFGHSASEGVDIRRCQADPDFITFYTLEETSGATSDYMDKNYP